MCTLTNLAECKCAVGDIYCSSQEPPLQRECAQDQDQTQIFATFAGSYGPAQSEVTAVPLWNSPLPNPQYAGYINIPRTSKYIFYHLIVSQQSPAEDPLVIRCITLKQPPSFSAGVWLFTERSSDIHPHAAVVNTADMCPWLL